jgi:hypothetical protein
MRYDGSVPSFTNPFFFGSPGDRESFTGRETLMPVLLQLMTERGRRLVVVGRRRTGKTALIKAAADRARATFVYCDLAVAGSLNEVARKLMDAVPQETGLRVIQSLEIAGKNLKSVGVSSGKVILTGELRPEDGRKTLEGVLNFLNGRATANFEVWTVCLDEFQEIRALGGAQYDWQLRGLTQNHRSLNYLFVGSDRRLAGWMAEPMIPAGKPLQQMEVGPMAGGDLARWIDKRARGGGLRNFSLGDQIVAAAGPCTGDSVRLAKVVFSLATGKATKDIVATAFDAIALGELHDEFLNHWWSLPANQRGVLRAIADGKAPMAADTLRGYGMRAASTASTAIEALVERQFLVRTDDGAVFDSPFFRRWVAFHGPPHA